MVGRMEGQSVVLRAEKGKLRLMVDDEDGGKVQEVVYEVNPQKEKEERDGKSGEGEGREVGGRGEEKAEGVGAYGTGEVPGGVDPLDGAEEAGRGLPGDGGGVGVLQQWQDRAMEGMLLALQPRVQVERGVALSPRLAVLLEKKSQAGSMQGLDRRLKKLQSSLKVVPEVRETGLEKKA